MGLGWLAGRIRQLTDAVESHAMAIKDHEDAIRTDAFARRAQTDAIEKLTAAIEKLVAGPPTDRRAVSIHTIGPPTKES
jgi:hypothetical protein